MDLRTEGTCNSFSGVVHSRHIFASLKRLSVPHSDSDAFFALLIKLGIAVPLDSCRCHYLLPFRLPTEKPGLNVALSQYLSPTYDVPEGTAPTYVRRLYSLEELPPNFWGKLVSALLLEVKTVLDLPEASRRPRVQANSTFWSSGIMTHYEDGCFVVNAVAKDVLGGYTEPIFGTKKCVDNGLDIIVFDRHRRFSALGWICSHIERLLQEWIINCGEPLN